MIVHTCDIRHITHTIWRASHAVLVYMASIYNTTAAFTSSLQQDALEHMMSYTYLPLQLLPARTHSNTQIYTLHRPKVERQQPTEPGIRALMCPGTWELAAHHTEPQGCAQRRGRARRAARLRSDGCERQDTGTSDGDLPSALTPRSGKRFVWQVPTPPSYYI